MADGGFAERVMEKMGHAEPDADEAGGAPDADADDEGESPGDIALQAINKNDGAALEAAICRIYEKHYGK